MSDSEIDFNAWQEPETASPILEPEIVDETETLPVLPTFDVQAVAARILRYEQEVALMEKRSRTITIIKDDATNLQAAEWGGQAKKLYKKLEELRKYFVRPHLDYNQSVNNFFKPFLTRLEAIDKSMGRLESAYARLKENERRIKEAEARKASQELEAKLAAEAQEAASKGVEYEPVAVVAPIIPEELKVTRTVEGSSSQRKTWTCTIIEPEKVPREYCVPDQRLLNEAVKGGIRAIAGCEIKEELSTVRRV